MECFLSKRVVLTDAVGAVEVVLLCLLGALGELR